MISNCNIYFLSNACAGFDTDACSIILKRFEYERIHMISSQHQIITDIPTSNVNFTQTFSANSLIADIEYSVEHAAFYSNILSKNSFLYIEERWRIKSYPNFINKFYYIQSYFSDSAIKMKNYISIKVLLSIRVYLLVSSKASPSWIGKEFRKLENMSLIFENDEVFNIYQSKRCFLKETITLGGNEGTEDCGTYIILYNYEGKVNYSLK